MKRESKKDRGNSSLILTMLGIMLIIAMLLGGCGSFSVEKTSQTQPTVEEPEPEPEPEPEKTPRELFLEKRAEQGISEEDVQEVLEELRGGKFIYFNLLTEDEQYVYAEEYIIATRFVIPETGEGDITRSETFYLWDTSESLTAEDFARVGLSFEWDQLELVYTNFLVYKGDNKYGQMGYVKFYTKYREEGMDWTKSKEVYDAKIESIRATADEMLKDLPDGDDYDKARYIFEKVCKRYKYKQSGPRLLYDIFQENETQCEGYAKTFAYLARRAGIEAGYMSGYPVATFGEKSDERGHAWCFVKLDGEYYYIDCTWADNDFGILYYYLGMTTAQMEENGYFTDYKYETIVIGNNYGRNVDPRELLRIPECTATKDCYVAREGEFIKEFSKKDIENRLKGKKKLILVFESSEEGTKCYNYLIEQKNLKKIWKSGYTWYHSGKNTFIIVKKS